MALSAPLEKNFVFLGAGNMIERNLPRVIERGKDPSVASRPSQRIHRFFVVLKSAHFAVPCLTFAGVVAIFEKGG